MRRRKSTAPQVSVAPLIDMMFILLIFFLVTASFARPRALEVERPRAAAAQVLAERPVMVTVHRDGAVFFGGRRVDLLALRRLLRAALSAAPERRVVVDADGRAPVGRLVDVLDECRAAGARHLGIAAEKEK